jgi:outer membrane protein OmpA-like peptidoglycan-associated protein
MKFNLTSLKNHIKVLTLLFTLTLAGCSFNPFIADNHLTGSPTGTLVGAGVGAGTAALIGAKPLIGPAAIAGGAIGYYVTSLRYDAAGLISAGGEVYKVGDLVGIYIPTDCLFRPNTCELTPQAIPVLNSVAAVLRRYPNHNILISGNTSGVYSAECEQRLSHSRAEKVAGYLWSAGINHFRDQSNEIRRLNYIGYGNYFPIASNLTNPGIRRNSRIQITAYPNPQDIGMDPHAHSMNNIGSMAN